MSLAAFQTKFYETFQNEGDIKQEHKDFINGYIDAEQAKYTSNKKDGRLTFGKFKDYSVDQIVKAPKGLDYLKWLLEQSWFNAEKFGDLYTEVSKKSSPIKKKKP